MTDVYEEKIQELLNKGYKEFTPGPLDSANRMFQKRFDDEEGKKYFITASYDCMLIHNENWEAIEYDTQFETDAGTVNIKWFSGYDVERVEAEAELMWKTLKAHYYEKKGTE